MDSVKAAIHDEIWLLPPASRIRAMRALLQYVTDEYTRVVIAAERELQLEALVEKNSKKYYYYPTLKPFPDPDSILAMSREESFKYQTLCKYRGYEAWLVADRRFPDEGRNLPFYEKFRQMRKISEQYNPNGEKGEYVARSESSYSEVKNEVTTAEILEYAEKVKSGQICVEVQTNGYHKTQLSPLFARPLNLDGKTWPSVEHYVLAQQFSDVELREKIRTTKTITAIRKLTKGIQVRDDWPAIRDGVMMTALEEKFRDDYLCAVLLSTHGFLIRVKHADPYWGGQPNRLGELLVELRERQFEIPEKRRLVGVMDESVLASMQGAPESSDAPNSPDTP